MGNIWGRLPTDAVYLLSILEGEYERIHKVSFKICMLEHSSKRVCPVCHYAAI